MKRREFIGTSISFSLLIAMHRQAQAAPHLRKTPKTFDETDGRFQALTLYTSKLQEQHHFYSTVLELPILDQSDSGFSIDIGASILSFRATPTETEPTYHYAINIPSNKFEKAKQWLSEKTRLLKDSNSGDDEYYFEDWDAHAIYFADPAGNIGELIARHTLNNDREGPFELSDLLCISEIGTPVTQPNGMAHELHEAFNLEKYHNSSMFVGDEYGLFVIPPIDRPWIPERTLKAAAHPVDIQLRQKQKRPFQFENLPYVVRAK